MFDFIKVVENDKLSKTWMSRIARCQRQSFQTQSHAAQHAFLNKNPWKDKICKTT